MRGQVRAFLVALNILGLYACSSVQTTPPSLRQQSVSSAAARSIFQASTTIAHYLYVTATNRVFIYSLPIKSPTAPPTVTLSGFGEATGIAVGTSHINVVDDSLNTLDIFAKSGANAYTQICSVKAFGSQSPFAIAAHGRYLYVTTVTAYGSTLRQEVIRFANGDENGTPLPCSGGSVVRDKTDDTADALSVAVNNNDIWTANNGDRTVTAYAVGTFTSTEAPAYTFTLPMGDVPGAIAVSNTDLYVTGLVAGSVYDYPLSSLTGPSPSPVATITLPFDTTGEGPTSPMGMTVYPAITSSNSNPTQLYISDNNNGKIYELALPLTPASMPALVTTTPATPDDPSFGLDAY